MPGRASLPPAPPRNRSSLTNRGITVTDLSGTRFLGLIQGVGWTLAGGLLAKTTVPPGVLELYGRLVVRWRGGLLGFDTFHKEEDERYDFFLLHRPAPDARATIIKQWSVPSDDINFSAAGGRTPVWGALAYAPDTETATVTLTGLRSAHEYRATCRATFRGLAKRPSHAPRVAAAWRVAVDYEEQSS